MTKLIVEINNPEDENLLIEIIKRLNLKVSIAREQETNAINWLKKISFEGGISSIQDPALWQKDLRRDRRLPGEE